MANYPYYDLCLSVDGYSVEKDFDNIYLGYNNFIEVQPTASVTGKFQSKEEVESFYTWWRDNTSRGRYPFIIKLDYFGVFAPFGVLQTSSLKETKDKSSNEYSVSFNIKIIFDESSIDNDIPIALPQTVYIPTNSKENYILLKGLDEDNDPFTFDLQVTQRKGEMRGELPALLYTPDEGFTGTDCISFVVSDFFSTSEPAVIDIIVSDDIRASHVVEYELSGRIGVNGNFQYSYDNVIWKRGFGGILPLGDTLLQNGSFNFGEEFWELSSDDVTIKYSQLIFKGQTALTESITQAINSLLTGSEYLIEIKIEDLKIGDGGIFINVGGTPSTEITEDGDYNLRVIAGSTSNFSIEAPPGTSCTSPRVELYQYNNQDKVLIASIDHQLDPRYPNVLNATVIKWGLRVNYSNYFLGQNTMYAEGFSISADAGQCIGTDFTSFFEDCSVNTLPLLSLKYAIDTSRMFYNSRIKRIIIDSANNTTWLYASEMFRYSDIEKVFSLDTDTVKTFNNMFSDTQYLTCIEKIDTLNYFNTSGMFDNTPLLISPDAIEQVAIMNGDDYDNVGGCGATITSISHESGSEDCTIETYGSTCVSTGVYKVNYSDVIGTPTFVWTITNGTIIDGGDTDTITVEVTAPNNINIQLTCAITDDDGVANSGTYTFTHDRIKGYIEIYLDKEYEQIILKNVIGSPSSNEIIVYNNVVNCTIICEDFPAEWNVTLVNNSELQGLPKGRTDTNYSDNYGLYISSPMRLINNGYIRGAGGYGGDGADGSDDSYEERETTSEYYNDSYWWHVVNGDGYEGVRVNWDGYQIYHDAYPNESYTGPFYHSDGYDVYRGSYEETVDGGRAAYGVYAKHDVSYTRDGGDGGDGGGGCGYNKDTDWDGDWRAGESGSASNPSGGNSGHTGGDGGWWGNDGYQGGGGGDAGYDGCPGISGSSNLSGDSITGNVDGGIV